MRNLPVMGAQHIPKKVTGGHAVPSIRTAKVKASVMLKLVWLRRVVVAGAASTCLALLPGESGVGGRCAFVCECACCWTGV